jgi:hypothetical protein
MESILKFLFMKRLLLFMFCFSVLSCSQKLAMSDSDAKELDSIGSNEEDGVYSELAEFVDLLEDGDEDEIMAFLKECLKEDSEALTKLYTSIDGDEQGFIHYAAAKGSLNVIKSFLELARSKGRLNEVVNLSSSKNKVQPIHLAALRGDVEIVRCFIDNGADPNAKDIENSTVMHYAVQTLANVEVVRYLLEEASNKASIEATIDEEDGSTVLHWAVENNNASMVKYLLNYCFSNGKLDFISKKDNENLTAEDLANNLEMVNVVLVYSSFKKRTDKI